MPSITNTVTNDMPSESVSNQPVSTSTSNQVSSSLTSTNMTLSLKSIPSSCSSILSPKPTNELFTVTSHTSPCLKKSLFKKTVEDDRDK